MPPLPPKFQDDAGDDARDKGESSGADEARDFIFFLGDLMHGGVEVAEVAGVKCGDMRLKLLPDLSPEGCIVCEVQWCELHQYLELLGGDLPLHIPKATQPVLILTRCHAEQQVEDGNITFAVNIQKAKTIEVLRALPCETPQELIGGAASL